MNAELAKHFQKYKDELYSREETSKTKKDTEQYSQRIATQLLRWERQSSWLLSLSFLGMAGETRDAISACTQVQMTEAPRIVAMAEKRYFWTYMDQDTSTSKIKK